jgi:hypothetical protein
MAERAVAINDKKPATHMTIPAQYIVSEKPQSSAGWAIGTPMPFTSAEQVVCAPLSCMEMTRPMIPTARLAPAHDAERRVLAVLRNAIAGPPQFSP